MRGDPIDVATLSMGRKGMARNGRQFAPLACGANDTLNYGEYAVIETPKFGRRKYKNNYNCEWNLVIPANSNLWFSCEYFDVKKGDYLYLAEMPLYGYSDTGFYMEPVTSPDYDVSVTLRFKTNKRRRGWGFRCYVDSEEQSFSPNATTTRIPAKEIQVVPLLLKRMTNIPSLELFPGDMDVPCHNILVSMPE